MLAHGVDYHDRNERCFVWVGIHETVKGEVIRRTYGRIKKRMFEIHRVHK